MKSFFISFIILISIFVLQSQQSNFQTNFLVTVEGVTTDGLNSFKLINNTGTMTINGVDYVALAYWTQVMDTFRAGGVWWINVVGIANDGSNLAIVYVDCTNNQLQSDYWEEDWNTFLASKTLQPQYVGVSCYFQPNINVQIPVNFPTLNAVPTKTISTGIHITNTTSNLISLTDNIGWIIYNNKNVTILPISTVNCWNCASNCGNYSSTESSNNYDPEQPNSYYGCYPGPWYEIHHAAVSDDSICFGIFYLFRQDHSFVQWNYTFCAPEVESPMQLYFAEWSGKLEGQASSSFEIMENNDDNNNDDYFDNDDQNINLHQNKQTATEFPTSNQKHRSIKQMHLN